ncbi:Methylmalonyl-CoA carboxyltransferase 12S subunit [BD1-7 clade bacterium]|uniref:Methylmalonyl-CoA carboxyltransferase 12S subunit n=1 Tax=BD1-7 clade bacterium TaxID=2029982 RepID=A0A5S9QLJ9_9GAMM|nr:Methylmalonyl-CoA carboxyltransferase 12S subunit [BD1-7 clade bacterium]CAA0120569.1 Methylmalonyl-CoA carboxyltransferase 12S subunit [BD1-7 clade bacterium]
MKNDIPQDWQILMQEYDERVSFARAMGGEEKLKKRKAAGQKNARELISLLCDSFDEVGTLVGSQSYHSEKTAPADALVGGIGQVNGKSVVIAVEDFTVQGGSIGHGTNAKRVRLAQIALDHQLPFIMLLDGAGARMTNGLSRHPYGPNDLQIIAQLKGRVPTIALVVGSSAGHGAVGGLLMDLVIMLDGSSMFSAGPPLVAAALGEIVSKDELGGAHMHTTVSGVAHNLAKDAADASRLIKEYLGYFTERSIPPSGSPDTHLMSLIPANLQTPYDMRPVIQHLADDGDFLEIQPDFGKAIITSLARLNGQSIGIVANQPIVLAGSINADAAEKAADFIRSLDALNLPILFIADTPGIMSGSAAERAGTLRSAARMYHAQALMTSPKLHVTLRKAFGFGSCVMAMNPFDKQTAAYGLPGVSLGGIPIAGGAEAANLDEETAQKLAEAQNSGAWTAGDALAYDEIVDPRDLRGRLAKAMQIIKP